MLIKDPKKRLGSLNDLESIKNHAWLWNIDWESIKNKTLKVEWLNNNNIPNIINSSNIS